MRALARHPADRPSSATAFAHDLVAKPTGAGEPPAAPTRILTPRPARYAPVRPGRLVGAALAVAAVAVAAIGVALTAGGDDPGPTRRTPPPPPERGSTPEGTARNLAAWLRANTRAD
jgi:hypothetical protein